MSKLERNPKNSNRWCCTIFFFNMHDYLQLQIQNKYEIDKTLFIQL